MTCVTANFEILQHLNLNIFQCIDFFFSRNIKNDPPTFNFHHYFLSFHIVCYKKKWHFSPFLWRNFWKNNNAFTTSHTSREILKLKYSVNYKTSMLLLLIIVAKKSPEYFWKTISMYTCSWNHPYSKWFFSLKYKYKVYIKVKIAKKNIINQDKKGKIYGKRIMNKLQH